MRRVVVMVVIGVLAVAVGASVGKAAAVNCGALSVGPGALVHGDKGGAMCLLRAYQRHCRPAIYRLSRFGVDTVALDVFKIVMRRGSCQVAVTTSFRVVPQASHTTGRGDCSRLRPQGREIVAVGCTGVGLPRSISLD